MWYSITLIVFQLCKSYILFQNRSQHNISCHPNILWRSGLECLEELVRIHSGCETSGLWFDGQASYTKEATQMLQEIAGSTNHIPQSFHLFTGTSEKPLKFPPANFNLF